MLRIYCGFMGVQVSGIWPVTVEQGFGSQRLRRGHGFRVTLK